MYQFEYVPSREYKPVQNQLFKLIRLIQNEVRDYFTFQYRFIGSSSRKMITCDRKNNIGYDFDVNFIINDIDNQFTPKQIKNILINAFNKHKDKFKYNKIEDSKRVITIKVVDRKISKILHGCDVAIVKNHIDDGYKYQEYIYHDKKKHTYEWKKQPDGFYNLPNREKWIKDNKLWEEVRNCYLDIKNENTNPNKKSCSLYAEAVNNIYNSYNLRNKKKSKEKEEAQRSYIYNIWDMFNPYKIY